MRNHRSPLLLSMIACLLLPTACGDTAPAARWFTPDSGVMVDGYLAPLPDLTAPDMPAPDDVTCPVTDVAPTDPSYAAVCWVVGKGVMEAPGGVFDPGGTFTRAVMAKHLVLLRHGTSFQLASSSIFADVPQSDPYYRYIQKLAEDRITVGCTVAGDLYCPGETATNAHGASLAVRMKLNAQPFSISSQQPYYSDVPTPHWGFKTIQRLHEDSAAVPCGSQTYCPDSAISRGKWAQVLYRLFSGN